MISLSLIVTCLSIASVTAFSNRLQGLTTQASTNSKLDGRRRQLSFFYQSTKTHIRPANHHDLTSSLTVVYASSNDQDDGNDLPMASTSSSSLPSSIPSTPFDRPLLALIDLTMLFIFASIGKASHSDIDGSLDLVAVAKTAGPFMLSWLVISPLLGCFTPMATGDLKGAALTASKGWVVAIPLGCIIRGILKGYIPPLPFVIVTMISTWVLLVAGRALYTALSELFVEIM